VPQKLTVPQCHTARVLRNIGAEEDLEHLKAGGRGLGAFKSWGTATIPSFLVAVSQKLTLPQCHTARVDGWL
jgi:hypothetical protein